LRLGPAKIILNAGASGQELGSGLQFVRQEYSFGIDTKRLFLGVGISREAYFTGPNSVFTHSTIQQDQKMLGTQPFKLRGLVGKFEASNEDVTIGFGASFLAGFNIDLNISELIRAFGSEKK
jgi:hypothetical protein